MKNLKLLPVILFLLLAISGTVNSQTAQLQIIHNAADTSAKTVDIYVNGSLAFDNFAFRTATSFQTLPAGVLLNVGVAPSNSMSVMDTLVNFPLTLVANQRYVAIANGVLSTTGHAANPDGANIGFTVLIKDSFPATASNPSNVDFIVEHGATDAPTVDVIARGVATLVNDASYGAITDPISVPAASYILDVTPGNDNTVIVASYVADLTTLAGGTAVVVASGFLDSTMNKNGPAFGLWAFLSNGTAIKLPAISQARLQVIHNAADPAADSVDVYVNGSLLLNDFAFRKATPYIDVPAGVQLEIGVAPSNSTSVTDTLKNFSVTLENGKTYVAIANGVLNPSGFSANPDSRPTAFTLFLQDQMREAAVNSSDIDIRAVHGASDAPTVDVLAQGVPTPLVDNAAYGDITNYFSVPAGDYTLDITPGNNNSVVVASFSAPLSTLAGNSAVVLASGFLDPSMNQNGVAFALIAVLPDGQVLVLNNTTGISEESFNNNFRMYPNPASDKVNLEFEKLNSLVTNISIADISGKVVMNITGDGLDNKTTINTSGLTSGTYVLKLQNDKQIVTRLLTIQQK